MANHFPSPPALQLSGVSYAVTLPGTPIAEPGSPFAISGVSTTLNTWFNAGNWGASFSFDVAGSPGGFDQDAVEQAMLQWLGYTAQALAVVTGLTAAEILSQITVKRVWTWTDGGTGIATWTDIVPPPVSVSLTLSPVLAATATVTIG
jgi:hypothetical protein